MYAMSVIIKLKTHESWSYYIHVFFFIVNTLLFVINLLIHHLVFTSCKFWTTYSIVRHKCTQGGFFFKKIIVTTVLEKKTTTRNLDTPPAGIYFRLSSYSPIKNKYIIFLLLDTGFYTYCLVYTHIMIHYPDYTFIYDYALKHFNLALGGYHLKARKTHDQVKHYFSGSPFQRQIPRWKSDLERPL